MTTFGLLSSPGVISRRYSVDITRASGLGWRPRHTFEDALARTVAWYRENETWWRTIKEMPGEFQNFYASNYGMTPHDQERIHPLNVNAPVIQEGEI